MESNEKLIEELKAVLAGYQAPDPVVMDMMPEATKDFIDKAPGYIGGLIGLVSKAKAESARPHPSVAELDLLKRAIRRYADESGAGVLFMQDLELCLNQVKAGR